MRTDETIERRLARLEAEVTALRAHIDIRRTLSRYAVAVDEKRAHLLRSLFTADAVLLIPEWQIEERGIEAVMSFYDYYWSRFGNPRRYYANEDIAVDGDTARAFMYWHVTQESEGESWLGWGTYEWDFHHANDAWRIASVVINLLAMTTLDAGWAGENRFCGS